MFALSKNLRFALPVFFVIGGCVAPSTEMQEPVPAVAAPVLEPSEAGCSSLIFERLCVIRCFWTSGEINRRGAMAVIEHRDGLVVCTGRR